MRRIINRTVGCLTLGALASGAMAACGSRVTAGGADPGGASSGVTVPQFPGAGTTGGGVLMPSAGPSTAKQCTGEPAAAVGPTEVVSVTTGCFYSTTTTTTSTPAATIEQSIEVIDGKKMVHIRITFDPGFVDNTYGDNAVGWGANDGGTSGPGGAMGAPGGGMQPGAMPGAMTPPGAMDDAGTARGAGGMSKQMPARPGRAGHTFDDLVGSDHIELFVKDGAGKLAMDFDLDYISVDPSAPCGYGTLGVSGGEGKVIVGSASAVLAVATSLDRDLNGCGYCSYTTDSPATDSSYTPNPAAPRWDYRVVYEVWLDAGAFGAAGFGEVIIENVHASPSKASTDTVAVTGGDCPTTWPKCRPDLVSEGLNCGKPSGGSSDASTGSDGGCPPDSIAYIVSEGATCVPRPVPGADGGLTCPAGYYLDPISEGRYCLPVAVR
jgi:hypothetical protein